MEIEHIEGWIGQDVVDVHGEKVGKLEEVYFRGTEAVLGEVKPGALSRKRLLVPLLGASASREHVRVDLAADRLLQEDRSGSGLSVQDLTGLADAYGSGYALSSDEIESATARTERLEAAEEAERRRAEADAEAERRSVDAETAAARADRAGREAEQAEEARRAAAAEAESARGRQPRSQ